MSTIGGGGRRSSSRKRDANNARIRPGTPIQMNAQRQPYSSAITPPNQMPSTPPSAMPTE
jgi:hypothetical protein